MLRSSEHMLCIQSMARMPKGYLWMPIGWNWLGMPTIVCVCMPFGRVYFKARGVKKDSVPDMIKVELTYITYIVLVVVYICMCAVCVCMHIYCMLVEIIYQNSYASYMCTLYIYIYIYIIHVMGRRQCSVGLPKWHAYPVVLFCLKHWWSLPLQYQADSLGRWITQSWHKQLIVTNWRHSG